MHQLTLDFTPEKPKTIPKAGVRHTSPAGEELIRKWEGLYLKAYIDPVGVLTIGYGTIRNSDLGINFNIKTVITEEQAVEWMRVELREKEASVNRLVKVDLMQHQYDAILSFVYNVGTENFSKSTFLKLINQKQFDAAGRQLLRWTKARDRRTNVWYTLRGLLNRRNDELLMWQGKEIALKGGDKIIPVRGNDVAAQKVSSATAAKDAARESNTVKGAAAVAVGSATYAATNMQTVLENPSLTFLIGLALGLSITGMFIIWKKFKDRD